MPAESFEDAFVKVWFDEQDPSAIKEGNAFYEEWAEHGVYTQCILQQPLCWSNCHLS